jgi:hypothetical protein
MWEGKLCEIYVALLPIVCQTEVMTCYVMSPGAGRCAAGIRLRRR